MTRRRRALQVGLQSTLHVPADMLLKVKGLREPLHNKRGLSTDLERQFLTERLSADRPEV